MNEDPINLSSFLGYKYAAKRVQDAIDNNQERVFPNCEMWAVRAILAYGKT
jgi:hypothetical protein